MFFVVVTILFELFIVLIALAVVSSIIQNVVLHEVTGVLDRLHIVAVFVDVVLFFFQLAVDRRQILNLIVILVFEY